MWNLPRSPKNSIPIIPRILIELLNHPDAATAQNVTTAMLQMKKIEIDKLKRVAAS
jgi:predicted 3-demethylubiquinone-9 3-methyltransferase (glyoxalase superfamily)